MLSFGRHCETYEDKRGYSSDICMHDLGGWTGVDIKPTLVKISFHCTQTPCPVCISCSSVFSSVGVIYGSVTLGYPFLPIGHWLLFPAASSPLFICLPFDFSSQRLLLQNSRGLIFTRCRQQQKERKEMQFLQTASKPHLEMV